MKNKLFALIASIAMIVIGCLLCYFAKYELVQISGFALTMFGAGLAVNQLWGSRDKTKPTWLSVVGMVLIGLGCFLAGLLALMTKEQTTTLIGMVFAFIVFVAGLVVMLFPKKKTE